MVLGNLGEMGGVFWKSQVSFWATWSCRLMPREGLEVEDQTLSQSQGWENTSHGVFNIFHQFLALFPSKGGDKFPSPWMWAELSDWLLTNRVRQQWECVISKIRWQRTLQLPLCAVSEGSQTPCCEQTQWTTGWKTEDSHPQLCESFWKWFLQP